MKTHLRTVALAVVLSSTFLLSQNPPVPLIAQPLVPASIAPGGPAFTLTVNGSGFAPGAVVRWNGIARPTTWVSGSQIKVSILAGDIAVPASATISVANPGPRISNSVSFQIAVPAADLSLTSGHTYTLLTNPSVSVAGDVNHDGKLDLAIANSVVPGETAQIFLGIGNGEFQTPKNTGLPEYTSGMILGNFDDDGRPDLAFTGSYFYVMHNKGDGTFTPPTGAVAGPLPFAIAAGDFNRDGKLDVAVTNECNDNTCFGHGGVSILLRDGNGTFKKPIKYGTPLFARSVVTGDFNYDGTLDLAVGLQYGNSLSIFLGNGDGTFQSTRMNVNTRQGLLVAADFNGDEKLDLAFAGDAAAVYVVLGNGDGTFQPPLLSPIPLAPRGLAVEDFNSDGILDLVTVGFSDRNVALVLLGKGDGTFQPACQATVGNFPSGLLGGDFNGDGRPDMAVLLEDGPSGTLSIMLNTSH